jgi:hypothetical protein
MYRRGGGGSSASPFRRWLAIIIIIIIISEDIKQEKARTFVGSIVDGTTVVTICDVCGGGVRDYGIPRVSCIGH